MVVGLAAKELDHGYIVGKSGGCADPFVEVGGEGSHLLESFVELFGSTEVVVGKDQRGAVAQLLELRGLTLLGGGQFDIHQLASDGRGFGEDVELGGDRAAEFASAGRASAGGDD